MAFLDSDRGTVFTLSILIIMHILCTFLMGGVFYKIKGNKRRIKEDKARKEQKRKKGKKERGRKKMREIWCGKTNISNILP